MTKLLRIVFWSAIALAIVVAITLALPVQTWRTGELPLPPLDWQAQEDGAALPRRLWIDTDAACGHSPRTDPDDCLAVALLARDQRIGIVGISTVFGNAPRDVVDRTTQELVGRIAADGGRALPLYPGGAAAIADRPDGAIQATGALTAALVDGPLVIFALGPLTNIVSALEARPDLRRNVALLVAVMGRRPGHLFHPAEGAAARSWLGHGPIFRDFNVAMDNAAVARVAALQLPLVLVPYDAARRVEITGTDLNRLERAGGATAWAAERARGWLGYWTQDIGRAGFFPFDLLAAGYVIDPAAFECANVAAWFGADPLQYFPSLMPEALLVRPVEDSLPVSLRGTAARYCRPRLDGFKQRLIGALTRGGERHGQ